MESKLIKRFGLFTAIAMVIGIVIGSGVFFKAEKILKLTGGSLPTGIFAWAIGGAIMIVCAYAFAILATRYEKVNGLVDYAEASIGPIYGYFVGWFMATIYYPAMTSVLAWASARYFSVLMGWDITGGNCLVLAGFFMVAIYAINALSPTLAGRFQVSTTAIKLIPLILMALVGTIVGFSSGMTVENFTTKVGVATAEHPLLSAVVASAFAYEGWIIATSINAELKDAKKNLPRALVLGTMVVAAIYILYSIGLSGGVTNEELMKSGEAGAKLAFSTVFGKFAGTGLMVLVVISCLGTLNGLMLGCTRGFYSLAARDMGPYPKMFRQVDPVTNMPSNSATIGLLVTSAWLVYFYGANLTEPWFGKFSFDSSELPIVTIYALYLPILAMMMVKEKDLSPFKRFVAPILAMIGSLFMVFAAIYAFKMTVVYYLIVFAVIMLLGAIPLYLKKK
ncbi:MAG TPA: APC family permease [Clostridiales bacterium]|mgnify:CR=1 FL=1|nr:APC family permease [Clostridiales bacterium]